jgi:DNA polymerase III delta prime subunit
LLDDVRSFFSKRSWYAQMGIPWRRGYLLYGPPGTGKTSMAFALAGELHLNLCWLSLTNPKLNDQTIAMLLQKTPARSLILIEDVDAFFAARQKQDDRIAVSFSGLLNALDGVAAQEGRIIFLTTNHRELLDPALIRPGRIDVEFKLDLASREQVGTMLLLALGMTMANPVLQMPAVTRFVSGGGPIIGGKLWPFLFITISCGALSGYHAIVCSGTTPKMVKRETDIRPIGYGAMLIEAFVAVVALISAGVLYPADYFAINTLPEVFNKLGMTVKDLPVLSHLTGERLEGRPGGAVALAVGMANIFSGMGAGKKLMSFWYHFAIMFQALFILTLIDAGTRAGRYLLQEIGGVVYKPLKDHNWIPGIVLTSFFICLSWGYLLYGGTISTIWPIFGVNNQLLGATAFAIGTTMLIRAKKLRYAWATIVPMAFLAVTSITASYQNIVNNYLPNRLYLLAAISIALLIMALLIITDSLRTWIKLSLMKP